MTEHDRKIESLIDYTSMFRECLHREAFWPMDKVAFFDSGIIKRCYDNDISPSLAIYLITGRTKNVFGDIKYD